MTQFLPPDPDRAHQYEISQIIPDKKLLPDGSVISGHDEIQPVSGPLTDEQLRAAPVPTSVSSLPLPTGAAQDGKDITTPTAMPAGGEGIRGWLSSIWTKLNGTLAVTGTVTATIPNPMPVTETEDNKNILLYSSGTVDYVCKAAIGSLPSSAVWQVRKIDTTSGVVITWADGNANYDNLATSLAVVEAFSYS